MADGRRDAPALSSHKIVSLLPGWEIWLLRQLSRRFSFVTVDRSNTASLAGELSDADVILADALGADVIKLCPGLRLVVCPFAGTERIDRTALPIGVAVINGGGTEEPIAEYVIGMLVALRRSLLDADRRLRNGEWLHTFWGKGPGDYIEELYGSSLGLLGFGRIGRETVKRATAFNIISHALTLHPDQAKRVDGVPRDIGALGDPGAVDALVANCDAIVICCELSDVTRGMIDARRFSLMKPNTVLINVARGPIVVERDLYEALRSRRIAGAAIDVWYNYPKAPGERAAPSAYPFAELDNIIMTPHYSGWSRPAMERRIAMLVRALEEFAAAN